MPRQLFTHLLKQEPKQQGKYIENFIGKHTTQQNPQFSSLWSNVSLLVKIIPKVQYSYRLFGQHSNLFSLSFGGQNLEHIPQQRLSFESFA